MEPTVPEASSPETPPGPGEGTTPRRSYTIVRVALALALLAAAGAAWALSPGVREFVATGTRLLSSGDVQGIRSWLLSYGAWAPVVSGLLMILQSVVAPLPAFVITFANGLLFGAFWGCLLSWSSAMAGASLCFFLSRALGRPAVEKLVGGAGALRVSDDFFARYGIRAILVARLLPFVPFDVISYGAGLTPMTYLRFFLATGIGQLPATVLYSWLGRNMTGGTRAVFWTLACGLSLLVLVSMLRSAMKREGVRPGGVPGGQGGCSSGGTGSRTA